MKLSKKRFFKFEQRLKEFYHCDRINLNIDGENYSVNGKTFINPEDVGKYIEFLKKYNPHIKVIGVLVDDLGEYYEDDKQKENYSND